MIILFSILVVLRVPYQPVAASMITRVNPSSYTPVTSDFDQLRLRILKHKRMTSRSGWAQNIAFTSTARRFEDDKRGVPPPGTYQPLEDMKDKLPKPNPRGGPFGSTAKVSLLPRHRARFCYVEASVLKGPTCAIVPRPIKYSLAFLTLNIHS